MGKSRYNSDKGKQQVKFKHQITYCMSKMSQNNDRYYGGYAASSGLPTEELRVQSSTFANYIAGTIGIVFFMFLVFVLLQIMTFIMMMFARNKRLKKPAPGFYNPQPMVQRYGTTTKIAGNGSSTNGSRVATLTRSEYSGFSSNPSTNPARSYPTYPRQVHTAMSAMSMQSQQSVTAQSTML